MKRIKLNAHIVAPSSSLRVADLRNSATKQRSHGIEVHVDPQCKLKKAYLAGSDEQRARAFLAAAFDSKSQVVWCARGGYGAIRLLPFLKQWTDKNGTPPYKVLVGFSDATVLLEFVKTHWGWGAIHGPMPGSLAFIEDLPHSQLEQTIRVIKKLILAQSSTPLVSYEMKLETSQVPKRQTPLKADQIVGGNLTNWAALSGTAFQHRSEGAEFLFLEDIDEALYRIDRMIVQLALSGAFANTHAVLLGEFFKCRDILGQVPRQLLSLAQALPNIIREALDQQGRSDALIFSGVPSGHGFDKFPVPFGRPAQIKLDPRARKGTLEVFVI